MPEISFPLRGRVDGLFCVVRVQALDLNELYESRLKCRVLGATSIQVSNLMSQPEKKKKLPRSISDVKFCEKTARTKNGVEINFETYVRISRGGCELRTILRLQTFLI